MASALPVLIVGAGPVGLMLALQLSRREVPFRLIDSKAEPTDQSRALGVQPRTLEYLDQIGIVDRFMERGMKIEGFRVLDQAETVAEVDIDLETASAHTHILILPQSETERLLIDRLREWGGEVEWNTTLESFDLNDDGVEATVKSPSGESNRERADWLVGCDGAHSIVRHGLQMSFEGAAYPETFLLADVAVDWDMPQDQAQILLTPDGALPAFPFHEKGRWRLIDTSGKFDSNEPAAVVSYFQDALRGNGHPSTTVSDPTWVSSFKIHRRAVGAMRKGRAFVAGDAAHIHSPAGGQGMNTGMQDSCNLAWKLAMVIQGKAAPEILDSYSTERLPIARKVLRGSDFATRLITLQNPVLKYLRNRLIGFVTRLRFVRTKLLLGASELAVHYAESPITDEDWTAGAVPKGFARGPKPGARVPDVRFGSERLYERLRGVDHVLLMFDGGSSDPAVVPRFNDLADRIARRYGDLVEIALVSRDEFPSGWRFKHWRDDGALHRDFEAHEPAMVLIRPDMYVGFRAKTSHSAPLERYLESTLKLISSDS